MKLIRQGQDIILKLWSCEGEKHMLSIPSTTARMLAKRLVHLADEADKEWADGTSE